MAPALDRHGNQTWPAVASRDSIVVVVVVVGDDDGHHHEASSTIYKLVLNARIQGRGDSRAAAAAAARISHPATTYWDHPRTLAGLHLHWRRVPP
jgi:hypothetical protein